MLARGGCLLVRVPKQGSMMALARAFSFTPFETASTELRDYMDYVNMPPKLRELVYLPEHATTLRRMQVPKYRYRHLDGKAKRAIPDSEYFYLTRTLKQNPPAEDELMRVIATLGLEGATGANLTVLDNFKELVVFIRELQWTNPLYVQTLHLVALLVTAAQHGIALQAIEYLENNMYLMRRTAYRERWITPELFGFKPRFDVALQQFDAHRLQQAVVLTRHFQLGSKPVAAAAKPTLYGHKALRMERVIPELVATNLNRDSLDAGEPVVPAVNRLVAFASVVKSVALGAAGEPVPEVAAHLALVLQGVDVSVLAAAPAEAVHNVGYDVVAIDEFAKAAERVEELVPGVDGQAVQAVVDAAQAYRLRVVAAASGQEAHAAAAELWGGLFQAHEAAEEHADEE